MRTHECGICKKQGRWSKSWSWYGSYRDIDDGNAISKFCSDKCRAVFEAKLSKVKEAAKEFGLL